MVAIAAKARVRMAKTRDERVAEEFPDSFIAPIEHDIVALSRPISIFRALSDRSLQAASASAEPMATIPCTPRKLINARTRGSHFQPTNLCSSEPSPLDCSSHRRSDSPPTVAVGIP